MSLLSFFEVGELALQTFIIIYNNWRDSKRKQQENELSTVDIVSETVRI